MRQTRKLLEFLKIAQTLDVCIIKLLRDLGGNEQKIAITSDIFEYEFVKGQTQTVSLNCQLDHHWIIEKGRHTHFAAPFPDLGSSR